jgi:hypothetical protein
VVGLLVDRGLERRVGLPQPSQPGTLRRRHPAGQPSRGQRVPERRVGVQRRHLDTGQRGGQLSSEQLLEHDPIRLVGAGERVLIKTRVDRFLSSPECVDVRMIGGKAGRHLGILRNGPMAEDQDVDVRAAAPSRSSAVS